MVKLLQAVASVLTVALSNVFVVFSWIKIEAQSPDRLVLNASSREIVADKLSRMISAYGRPIASFDSIDTIDVKHFINGRKFEWWVVSLHLFGQRTIRIGRAVDGFEASRAAASLSTITGKRVRALRGWGFSWFKMCRTPNPSFPKRTCFQHTA
ncbi:hypothetical protein ACEN8I_23705 [Polaromonas sp. CT11-55]|uniref:hypothetical protein n=1 Tax=Polaromonas sp. CT11-55 TaxID=3243045 RepID=UPI0039A72CC2